jgi:hemerythrin
MSDENQLVWKDEYSVNVKEIDEQHKNLFKIINSLIKENESSPSTENIRQIIGEIVQYKENHFCTEEKYFKEFNFEGAAEHINAHTQFTLEIGKLKEKYGDDVMGFSFALVDFLEDWLIGHLMNMDKKYVHCFNSHGLT